MTGPDRRAAEDALAGAYATITQVAGTLTEATAMLPSRCAGWTVHDTATLAVEAAIHYLDMTAAITAAPEPDPASLALVRSVLSHLAGTPLPADWDDITCALKGTGRLPVSQADQSALGAAAGKLPLFG
jgi:hypothetical protein